MERRCWSAGNWKGHEMIELAAGLDDVAVEDMDAACSSDGGGAFTAALLAFPHVGAAFFTTRANANAETEVEAEAETENYANCHQSIRLKTFSLPF